MRVIHAFKVYRPDSEGGIPEVIGRLTDSADPDIENRILVARDFGYRHRRIMNGVPVEAVTTLGTVFSMPIAPTFPFALARAAQDVDVVALHVPFPLNDIGIMLGIPDRAGLVVHWHSEIMGRRFLVPLVAPFIRNTLARADRIIVSSSSAIALSPFLAEHAEKCVVIPFGVDADYWGSLSTAEQAETEQLRAVHPRMVMATGRLVPYKGFDVLVRALRQVNATAVIVGDGPCADALSSLAARLGVPDRLFLVGEVPRDRLKLFLHAARIFVFPSMTAAETFGIAQLEAMAAGLPIINTALPTGVPLVARNEREALTVKPGDASALAAAIDRLLNDSGLASALGNAGRRRAESEYSLAKFVREVRGVYQEVYLKRSRGVAREP
jgi:glycosyltransferase involved in cell wall biosynthesis